MQSAHNSLLQVAEGRICVHEVCDACGQPLVDAPYSARDGLQGKQHALRLAEEQVQASEENLKLLEASVDGAARREREATVALQSLHQVPPDPLHHHRAPFHVFQPVTVGSFMGQHAFP